MANPTYEQLFTSMDWGHYLQFTLARKRFRSFRVHLGEEAIPDKDGEVHVFDLVWFKDTKDLIAVEVEESLGIILPFNFKLKRNTDKYVSLGKFTEKEIDELLVYRGRIIEHLWGLREEAVWYEGRVPQANEKANDL